MVGVYWTRRARIILVIATLMLTLWADPAGVRAALPAPVPTAPESGALLSEMTVTLAWDQPAGATQYQLQVLPADGDGPGVNLIRNAEGWFTIPAPPTWYILLPDLTYTWRVRATDATTALREDDPAWGPWSEGRTFRTPSVSSAGIQAVAPASGALLEGSGPAVLQWHHPDPAIFFFEVQVSGDTRFDPDPATATSFVWWNFVHGGVSNPPHAWRTPPLEPDTAYFWRVRPRVHGDGPPVAWSPAFSFRTPLEPVPPRREVFLDDLDYPVSLRFAPDGRLFYNELRTGNIRIVADGQLQPEPFATLTIVQGPTEHGLLGLALHPDFTQTPYVYVFYSEPNHEGRPGRQRVVRFTEVDGRGTDFQVILEDLPTGPNCCHNGGRLAFGHDGKLYVSIGDAEDPQSAQDMGRLSGKILRVHPDGTIPEDNPFPGSPVYALGLRNPFGLTVHPTTGVLYATDNGPTGNDEVNRIVPGANYGWPVVQGTPGDPRFIDPLWLSRPAVAPTGLTFSAGRQFPQFRGDLFFCAWNTGNLTRLRLAAPDYDQVTEQEVVAGGCNLDVTNGPDGTLYFSNSSTIFRLAR